jgi:hypothetical protein
MKNTEATKQCEASINLTGPGRRGKTGRCPNTASRSVTLAVLMSDDVSGVACQGHARRIDGGLTVYKFIR